MKENIRDFLSRFSTDELENRGVLRPDKDYNYLLKRESVSPLIRLMCENGVGRLSYDSNRWFLTSDGEFQNPGSSRGDPKQGRIEDLRNPGNIFTGQNKNINPFFQPEASEN